MKEKELIEYLDKAGQYFDKSAQQTFKIYTHGIYVESILLLLLGMSVILISLIAMWVIFNNKQAVVATGYAPMIVLGVFAVFVIGVVMIASSATGIITPEYVALQRIADYLGGKK